MLTKPTPERAKVITDLLESRRVINRCVLPDGGQVEMSTLGDGTTFRAWLVTWSGPLTEPFPEAFPAAILAQYEAGGHRHQTWAFYGDTALDCLDLLREHWGLEPRLRSIGQA